MRPELVEIRELDQTFRAQQHYNRNGIWIENSFIQEYRVKIKLRSKLTLSLVIFTFDKF